MLEFHQTCSMKWGMLCVTAVFMSSFACNKTGENQSNQTNLADTAASIITYQIVGMSPQVSFEAPNIYVQFPDSTISPGNLIASFTLSVGAHASIQAVDQTSGVSTNNFDYALIYDVTSASGNNKNWEVIGTNNNYTLNWGLGQWLQRAVSNNRDYEWYIGQQTTDSCGDVNCGPTSVTMAIKWADSTNTTTVTDARIAFRSTCGTWTNNYLADYLNQNAIPFNWTPLPESATQMRDNFKAQIDSGRILIISLTMSSIRLGSAGSGTRVDRYYDGGWDHCIILKGYKQVDNELFFEVYDPWDPGGTYTDGTPLGENRYYRYEDIFTGCYNAGVGGGTGTAELSVYQKR